jgi:hypothetical protein
MGQLLHGVWSEGMLRMSMELCSMRGGLLWWLFGCECVAWFGSTGQDLLTRLATVPAGRVVCAETMPQLMMFDDVGEICSSTSFKGTCHDQR